MMLKKGLSFQLRVQNWLMECFSNDICRDKIERCHRLTEETLELVQSVGMTAEDAHQLVNYVYDRPAGESLQEVGGVLNTLAALCSTTNIDMESAGEIELERCWKNIEKIRAKHAAKPKFSPLPQ
jgi:NTP pyrophosphatase (non-canonical NTP hydrolase)